MSNCNPRFRCEKILTLFQKKIKINLSKGMKLTMKIELKELQHNNHGEKYPDGYRLVYFYDDSYFVGEYCKTVEGFMIGLSEYNPILDETDIPSFISIENLLAKSLTKTKNAEKIALYKTDGTYIASLDNKPVK